MNLPTKVPLNASVLILGVIWAKYGLWRSKSLSREDNLLKGEWIIFGTWPDNLKRNVP